MAWEDAVQGDFPGGRCRDIHGLRVGRIVVQSYYGRELSRWGTIHYWRCRCDCGQQIICPTGNLTRSNTGSCGCLKSEKLGDMTRVHGLTGTSEHHVWQHMRQRCNDPNIPSFKNYGGRGISVCDRWDDFTNFLADIGPRPSKRHSIERIDNDGNYEPGNCRWATPEEQHANTRRNVFVEWCGERMILAEAIRRSGIPPKIADNRLRRGWPLERALTTPLWEPGEPRTAVTSRTDGIWVEVGGEQVLLKIACRRLGLKYGTVHSRIQRGMTPQDALY